MYPLGSVDNPSDYQVNKASDKDRDRCSVSYYYPMPTVERYSIYAGDHNISLSSCRFTLENSSTRLAIDWLTLCNISRHEIFALAFGKSKDFDELPTM